MFAKATKNFTRQIDPDGCLIPVSRLNNSDKLDVLSLVIKRNPFWFWQRPKYLPTDFTLSDVLLGEPLRPDVVESDFLKYEGLYSDSLAGKIDAGLGSISLNLEGKGSSKLQSSFGHLRKQEVDVQKLLLVSRDRLMNLDHCLVQQTREKRNDVFGVLKERIFTTQPCSITQEVMGRGSCGTMFSFLGLKDVQVSVSENRNMESDNNVSMEIPPHTVIAYSIIELEVKRGGQYELCLQPDTLGGFEADSVEVDPLHASHPDLVVVDGLMAAGSQDELLIPGDAPLGVLDEHLQKLKAHLQQLADLPAPTRSRLFLLVTRVLEDRVALGALDAVLDEWCQGGTPDPGDLEQSPSLEQVVRELVEILQLNWQDPIRAGGHKSVDSSPLTAVYLLISAMDEMTDVGLAQLEWFWRPRNLQALNSLVSCLLAGGEWNLQDPLMSSLAGEEGVQRTERLFLASNVKLVRTERGRLRAETSSQPGLLPLVMCVTVQGLASLGTGQ